MKGKDISASIPDWTASDSGLVIFFAEGGRPGLARLREMASDGHYALSHEAPAGDPGPVTGDAGSGGGDGARQSPVWAELLRDGLTFDCVGLSPGFPVSPHDPIQSFGIDGGERPADWEGIELRPGPHIAAGLSLPPVYRALMSLGASLVKRAGAVGVGWGAARTLMSAEYFVQSVTNWLAGGTFPALGLAAMVPEVDDGLHSTGLLSILGHEIRIEPSVGNDLKERARVAVRVADQLVARGIFVPENARLSLDSHDLELRLSRNGRYIRVFPEGEISG